MSRITVYSAEKIVTMDPHRPLATHVAVRDGLILGTGDLDDLADWGPHGVDDRFAGKVIVPGFVEGHAHVMAGGIWDYVYCGYHERRDPGGSLWPGLADTDAVIARLKQAESKLTDPATPLVAWGFDPIFLAGRRLDRHHLDQVSPDRPIAVIHSNFHLLTANTAALRLAGYDKASNIEGVLTGETGEPLGELQEMAAMFPVLRRLGIDFAALSRSAAGIGAYGQVARLCGVTTVTDLYAEVGEEDIRQLSRLTGDPAFPVRLVPAMNAMQAPPGEIAERALAARKQSTDKLRLGIVKIMTDGSIQGFTAQLLPPHYYKGPNHAIWNIAPEQLDTLVDLLHGLGIHMHIHVNGDLASKAALDAFDLALARHPRGDHRHTLQHVQLAGRDQFRRMKALGLCANLFANHLYYFGDQHHDLTVGPDRARRMNACRSALDLGVPLAIHSDAPVTPMGPLFTAWCAVNRQTMTGRTLGDYEKITVPEALYAITLGAAYTLKMDHEIGSIECGKRADFAILDDDPLTIDAARLKDIAVAATVLAGIPTAAA